MKINNVGFTLVELMVCIAIISILSLSSLTLMNALLHGSIVAQRQAVALTLANNQMEYLKSLPYDNLAVAGGPIYSTSTIPGVSTQKVEGYKYTVTTTINYVDDAYDGCGSYPNLTIEKELCRNYPPPSGAPSPGDTDDYKEANVVVTDESGDKLASLDTDIASLVAETESNTGALFVYVIDDSGDPITGANVNIVNTTVSPNVNANETTDQNGIAVFYNFPLDTTGYNYAITSSLNGYSTLATIKPSGALTPTYSSQNILAQTSSYVTLTLKPMGTNSLLMQSTDTSGNPIASAKVYVKGGYKKYTSSSDTEYYFDTTIPTNTSPVTDSNGYSELTNLVPGDYYFCGDDQATSCTVNGTKYYLAAAVPYGGSNPLLPIIVPDYTSSNPPSTTYPYGGVNYLQEVRLMLTTNSSFPRVESLSPFDGSLASGVFSNFSFALTGYNLPCSANASSCSTHVSFTQGGNNYTASCTGGTGSSFNTLNCTVNMASAATGNTQLVVTSGGNTLTLPASPLIGGIIVNP